MESSETKTQQSGEATKPTLKWLSINSLEKHPQYPRLELKMDVIDHIKNQIKRGGFSEKYAICVRPISDDKYQIVSGHHRVEAAKMANIDTIPAWVEDMSDETAYMELIFSNFQSGISTLEIGIHVLKYVELGVGGRNRDEGLSKYARAIGKDEKAVRIYRNGAIVFEYIRSLGDVSEVSDFHNKVYHLAEIKNTKEDLWDVLVDYMFEEGWSVRQTKNIVEIVNMIDKLITELGEDHLSLGDWLEEKGFRGDYERTRENLNNFQDVIVRYVKDINSFPNGNHRTLPEYYTETFHIGRPEISIPDSIDNFRARRTSPIDIEDLQERIEPVIIALFEDATMRLPKEDVENMSKRIKHLRAVLDRIYESGNPELLKILEYVLVFPIKSFPKGNTIDRLYSFCELWEMEYEDYKDNSTD